MAGSATIQEPNGTNGTAPGVTASALSADEFAQYDRQIRLWGAQAQERIRSADILLISLRALGTEIAKNLTLAGISSLTIIDDELVTEEDLGAQYFLREEDVGKPRAESAIPRIQELNPRVTIKSNGSLNDLLQKDQTYYAPFSCIIACDHDFMTLSLINAASRVAQRPFYAAGIHGFYGYIFADLFGHEFVVEREKSNVATQIGPETLTRAVLEVTSKKDNTGKAMEIVKKQEIYCPLILANSSPLPPEILNNRRKLKAVPALLPCLRALFDFQRGYSHLPTHTRQDLEIFTQMATQKSRELMLPPETLKADFLRSFIQNIGAEIVPTAAFVGGRVSEDVINVLGKREQPIQNFALFDGEGLDGRIYCLFSMPPELSMDMNVNMTQMNGTSGTDGMIDLDGMTSANLMRGHLGMGMPGMTNDLAFMPGDSSNIDGDAGIGGPSMQQGNDIPSQTVSGAPAETLAPEPIAQGQDPGLADSGGGNGETTTVMEGAANDPS